MDLSFELKNNSKKPAFESPNLLLPEKDSNIEDQPSPSLRKQRLESPKRKTTDANSVMDSMLKSTQTLQVRDSRHNIPMKAGHPSRLLVSKAFPKTNASTQDLQAKPQPNAKSPVVKRSPSPVRDQKTVKKVSPVRQSGTLTATHRDQSSKKQDSSMMSSEPQMVNKKERPLQAFSSSTNTSLLKRASVSPVQTRNSAIVTQNNKLINKNLKSPNPRNDRINSSRLDSSFTKTQPIGTPRTPVIRKSLVSNLNTSKNFPTSKPTNPMSRSQNVSRSPIKSTKPTDIKKVPVKLDSKLNTIVRKTPPVGSHTAINKSKHISGKSSPQKKNNKEIAANHQVSTMGNIVFQSVVLPKKEQVIIGKMPIKSIDEIKRNSKRVSLMPEEMNKALPMDDDKKNCSFRSIDVSAISGFEKKVAKNAKSTRENSNDRHDFDAQMVLKNLEEFEKNYDSCSLKRTDSLRVGPTVDNRMAEQTTTTLVKGPSTPHLTMQDPSSTTSIGAQKSEKPQDLTDNKISVKDDISDDIFPNTNDEQPAPPSARFVSMRTNIVPAQFAQCEVLQEFKRRYGPYDGFDSVPAEDVVLVRAVVEKVVDNVVKNLDDVLVNFNSRSSENKEMSQLLAKYTNVSFQNNIAKMASQVNTSFDKSNASFIRAFGKSFDGKREDNILSTSHSKSRGKLQSPDSNNENKQILSDNNNNSTDNDKPASKVVKSQNAMDIDNKTSSEFLIDTFKYYIDNPIPSPIKHENSMVRNESKFGPTSFNFQSFNQNPISEDPIENNQLDNKQYDSPHHNSRKSVEQGAASGDLLMDKKMSEDGPEFFKGNPTSFSYNFAQKYQGNNNMFSINGFLRPENANDSEQFEVLGKYDFKQYELNQSNHADYNVNQDSFQVKESRNFAEIPINQSIQNLNPLYFGNTQTSRFNTKSNTSDVIVDENQTDKKMFNKIAENESSFGSKNQSGPYSFEQKNSHPTTNLNTKNNFLKDTDRLDSPTRPILDETTSNCSNNNQISSVGEAYKLNNSTSFADDTTVRRSGRLEVLDLTNVMSMMNSKSDVIYKLTILFKRILVYSSKVESLKAEIFSSNSSFNLVNIFQLYDAQRKGELDHESFVAFLADVGFQVSENQLHKIIFYLNKVICHETDEDHTSGLQLQHFASIFLPLNSDNNLVFKQAYQISVDKQQDEIVISELEFYLMRQVLIVIMKKLEDLSAIVESLAEHSIEELFQNITKAEQGNITWKNLSAFLEENGVRFIEEDLVFIFRDFQSKNMATISLKDFREFFNLKLWKL